MCRSKAEGGQRCFAHADTNLTKATSRYRTALDNFQKLSTDPAASPEAREKARQKVHDAAASMTQKQVELASTPKGAARFQAQMNKAARTGDADRQAYYADVLKRGEAVREQAKAIYDQVKNAKARADVPVVPVAPEAAAAPARMPNLGGLRRPTLPTRSLPGAPERVQALQKALPTGGLAGLLAQRGPATVQGNLSRLRPPTPLAARQSLPSLRDERESARERLNGLARTYEQAPSDAGWQSYQDARAAYQAADRAFLRALPRPSEGTDFTREQLWSGATGGSLCDRTTAWRSLELAARDYHTARVQRGDMSAQQFTDAVTARARARQSVLDREGRGEFDPVNPRFAAAERARRGELIAA